MKPENTGITHFNKFVENCPNGATTLSNWTKSNKTFTDISQIVKDLTGVKAFTHRLKELFPFNPPPPKVAGSSQRNTPQNPDGNKQF